LITYAEKGGVLETHKDVPDEIQEELYMEEQQRLEKEKRKSGTVVETGTPYVPININVLPSQPPGLEVTAPKKAVNTVQSENIGPLNIPGLRDAAVKEYGEWLASRVGDDILKASFRQACDVTLSDGFDLEHIHKDQDPEFFVAKGIKPGIARSFVENIQDWVDNVKNRGVYS
jgi:hypothetical protein